MYEKSALPPKGSLREALFLTVWLRRQEAEVYKTRVIAQGVVDLSEDGAKGTADVFKKYLTTMLPFLGKDQEKKDEKLKKELKTWTDKGVIYFDVQTGNPLKQRVKTMQVDAETRAKLANRKRIVEL